MSALEGISKDILGGSSLEKREWGGVGQDLGAPGDPRVLERNPGLE